MLILWPAVAATLISATTEPSSKDFGGEVRAVFALRCASCHGPDLASPRGRFGYVLDLPRVASNTEMVIPAHPEESELWELVRRGEMPPPDSPGGQLTDAEKETVRAWIAVGAPDAVSVSPATNGKNVSRWAKLGRLHLLALHFPIALVLAAGFFELRGSTQTVRGCLALAGVAAGPTVVLGWLHASAGAGGSSPMLEFHRWLGTAAGLVIMIVAVAVAATGESRRYRWLLFPAIVLTIAAAHYGGLLVHGPEFFDF